MLILERGQRLPGVTGALCKAAGREERARTAQHGPPQPKGLPIRAVVNGQNAFVLNFLY
jgi:hypothetical protein